jgi:hypothetical protein
MTTSQYLVTVRVSAVADIAEQVKHLLKAGLSAAGDSRIRGCHQATVHATRWGVSPDLIGGKRATFITCRLFARLDPNALDGFASSLQRKIQEIVSSFHGSCKFLGLDSVVDPMAARPIASTQHGLAAATNQIVCDDPPYVR